MMSNRLFIPGMNLKTIVTTCLRTWYSIPWLPPKMAQYLMIRYFVTPIGKKAKPNGCGFPPNANNAHVTPGTITAFFFVRVFLLDELILLKLAHQKCRFCLRSAFHTAFG